VQLWYDWVRVVYVWVANLSILFTFVAINRLVLRSGSTSENLLVPETMHSAYFFVYIESKEAIEVTICGL